MNTLNSAKGKIKTDLQVYLPAKLDADFEKIINELDAAITETSLTSITMQTEHWFWKKVEQHSKNREKLKQDFKKNLEDAIDKANSLVSKLNESALNSEDKTLSW